MGNLSTAVGFGLIICFKQCLVPGTHFNSITNTSGGVSLNIDDIRVQLIDILMSVLKEMLASALYQHWIPHVYDTLIKFATIQTLFNWRVEICTFRQFALSQFCSGWKSVNWFLGAINVFNNKKLICITRYQTLDYTFTRSPWFRKYWFKNFPCAERYDIAYSELLGWFTA